MANANAISVALVNFSPKLASMFNNPDAVPRIVNRIKKLKKVKKKFLDITDSSTSPCEIMPCLFDNPINSQRLSRNING